MTVRLRLTLLYGGLFLTAGAVLLAFTYLFVAHSPWPAQPDAPDAPEVDALPGDGPVIDEPGAPVVPDELAAADDARRDDDLRRLLTGSGIALGVMAVASTGLGWYVAGRVLRPLSTITARTRQISSENLHERLHAAGPDDELKTLADTIDQLLARLDRAFESQRRFVANASHELRTPLTVQRTVLEVALADPDADGDALRAACRQALGNLTDQERLIDALLALARSQSGPDRRTAVDLATVVERTLRRRRPATDARGLRVEARLDPAPVVGDVDLLERMVANLVDNAATHNREDGWVEVVTGAKDGVTTMRMANSGRLLTEADVPRLLEPFQRGRPQAGPDGAGDAAGLGLGLSIIDAVVVAHGGRLSAQPVSGGGLAVEIRVASQNVDEPSGRG